MSPAGGSATATARGSAAGTRATWRWWTHPQHGRFPVRIEAVEAPRYAAFRWAFAFPGEVPDEANSTRVEFWLSERDGGTLLRVVESGFANLIAARGLSASIVDGNVKGWTMQLEVARATAEQVTA